MEHSGDNTGHEYRDLTSFKQLGEFNNKHNRFRPPTCPNELRMYARSIVSDESVPELPIEPELAKPADLAELAVLTEPEPETASCNTQVTEVSPTLRNSSVGFGDVVSDVFSDLQETGRRCCCNADSFVQVALYLVADRILQFDSKAYRKALDRIWSTNLVFLMVGYVFLVSTSLEPMSCIQDLNKKWYMIAHTQQQCNWCESSDQAILSSYVKGDFSADVPYPLLAIASISIASIYGLGIPILFFHIMYSHAHDWEGEPNKETRDGHPNRKYNKDYGKLKTANLKKWKFVRRYGFLTTKTSEKYYYWEVMIIIRKLMLSLITKGILIKNQKSDPNSGARQALCNMFVLVIACTAQAYARPFAHQDANFAESGLLLCAVLLVLVGMGTREVRDDMGRHIDDPPKVEEKLSTAESGMFYIVIYSIMIMVILGTLAIIMRRVGSLLHQVRVGRQRDGRELTIQRSDPVPVMLDSAAADSLKGTLVLDKTSKLPKMKKLKDILEILDEKHSDELEKLEDNCPNSWKQELRQNFEDEPAAELEVSKVDKQIVTMRCCCKVRKRNDDNDDDVGDDISGNAAVYLALTQIEDDSFDGVTKRTTAFGCRHFFWYSGP
eukprot:COSAG01_NODE_3634_length_5845_cov_2.576227_2_plen_610_part_00